MKLQNVRSAVKQSLTGSVSATDLENAYGLLINEIRDRAIPVYDTIQILEDLDALETATVAVKYRGIYVFAPMQELQGDDVVAGKNGTWVRVISSQLATANTIFAALGYEPASSAVKINNKPLSSMNITLNKSDLNLGNVDNTSDAEKPLSNAAQQALNGKADLVLGKIPAEQIPDFLDDVKNFATLAQFPTIGSTGVIYINDSNNSMYIWNNATQTYIPATGNVSSVNGKVGTVVLNKTDIGLGNVDNTSDANKPISTAVAAALALKAESVHTHTKSQVGLANVDNTSDINKPISTATQSALDNKADLVGGKVPAHQLPSYVDEVVEYANLAAFPATGSPSTIYVAQDTDKIYRWTGTSYVDLSGNGGAAVLSVNGQTGAVTLNKASIGLGNVDNTSDADKPISNAVATALTGKSDTGHTHTKSQVGLDNVDNTSDDAKNSATATLTNKTLSGANNVFSNIPTNAISGLDTALASKQATLVDTGAGKNFGKVNGQSILGGDITITGSSEVTRTTIAGLKVLASPVANQLYYVADPEREGFFYYDPADTTSSDPGGGDGGLFISGPSNVKFKRRLLGKTVYLDWFVVSDYKPVLNYLLANEYVVYGTLGKDYPATDGITCTDKTGVFIGNKCNILASSSGAAKTFFTHTQTENPSNQRFTVESLTKDITNAGNILTVSGTMSVAQGDMIRIWAEQPVHPFLDGSARSGGLINKAEYLPVQKVVVAGGKTQVYTYLKTTYNFQYIDTPLTFVRVASTVDVNISTPGATIDGITLANNDRVLLKNQTTTSQNGVYVFNGASSAMTRATDADTWLEIYNLWVVATEGTQKNLAWIAANSTSGTLGSSAITFNSYFNPRVRVATATADGNTTISNPGKSVFDGVTLVSGDRILIKNQTNQAENGVYIFNGSASALTRATDFNTTFFRFYTGWVQATEGTQATQTFAAIVPTFGTTGTTIIPYKKIGSVRISLAKEKTLHIQDVTIKSATPQYSMTGLLMRGTFDPFINNVTFEGFNWPSIQTHGIFNGKIIDSGSRGQELLISGSGGYGPQYSVGYGINDCGSFGLQVIRWNQYGGRHAYTTGAGDEPVASDIDGNYYSIGEPLNVMVRDGWARNMQAAAWDTHPTGYGITFHNCNADNCPIGYQFRTRNMHVKGGVIQRCGSVFAANFRASGATDGTIFFEEEQSLTGVTGLLNSGLFSLDGRMNSNNSVRGKVVIRGCDFQGDLCVSDCNYVDLEIYSTSLDIRREDGAASDAQWLITKAAATIKVENCSIFANPSGAFMNMVIGADNNQIYLNNVTFEIGTGSAEFANMTNATNTNSHFRAENIKFSKIGPSFSQFSNGTSNIPFRTPERWTSFQANWKTISMNGSTSNRNSFYWRCSAPSPNLVPVKYVSDDVVTLLFNGLTANYDTGVLPAGNFTGQKWVFVNNTAFTITIPAQGSLTAKTIAAGGTATILNAETIGWMHI